MSQGIKKEKLNQLQFLRFLAFMLVFLRHAEKWVHFPTPKGNSVNAITFFFMLSGFVGAYSLEGRIKGCGIKDIFIFMKKKIVRLGFAGSQALKQKVMNSLCVMIFQPSGRFI